MAASPGSGQVMATPTSTGSPGVPFPPDATRRSPCERRRGRGGLRVSFPGGGAGQSEQSVSVPVDQVRTARTNPPLHPAPDTVPPEVRAALERMGYQVQGAGSCSPFRWKMVRGWCCRWTAWSSTGWPGRRIERAAKYSPLSRRDHAADPPGLAAGLNNDNGRIRYATTQLNRRPDCSAWSGPFGSAWRRRRADLRSDSHAAGGRAARSGSSARANTGSGSGSSRCPSPMRAHLPIAKNAGLLVAGESFPRRHADGKLTEFDVIVKAGDKMLESPVDHSAR